jgi:hypothetical protein
MAAESRVLVEQHHFCAALRRRQRCTQAGRAAADYRDLGVQELLAVLLRRGIGADLTQPGGVA